MMQWRGKRSKVYGRKPQPSWAIPFKVIGETSHEPLRVATVGGNRAGEDGLTVARMEL